jgi:hypothetical protein
MINGHFPDRLMSRRKFLGLGAGALATFGLGSSAHSTPFGSYFYEPEVRSSANGFLSTTLRASRAAPIIDGEAVVTSVYEGTFPAPTLKIRPGDFLRIELINDLSQETNLHLHGIGGTRSTTARSSCAGRRSSGRSRGLCKRTARVVRTRTRRTGDGRSHVPTRHT